MNEIRIPFQFRDQPIGEVLSLNLAYKAIKDPEERCLVDGIVFDAACEPGLETVGDLLDQLEAAGVAGRRKRVDAVRVRMGLKTLDEVDGEAKVEAATRSAMAAQPLRDAAGRRFQECGAEGCVQVPVDELGMQVGAHDRKWFCPAHRELAGPDDHLPEQPDFRGHVAQLP